MKPGDLLHDIFQREIARLHEQSQTAPLDVSDLVRLEKLVSSYRKFLPNDPTEPDQLDDLPTEELLKRVNNADPARAPTAEAPEVSTLEEGRDLLAPRQDPDGDEG